MSKVLVDNADLSGIASAIRQKSGTSTGYKPSEMAQAIEDIPTGITPTGTVNISQNGTVDVTQYASAVVNVPNSYSASDEGKVVSGGVLVAQTARLSQITQNGTYDTTENNSVIVNVSGGGGGGEYELLDYIQSDGTQSIDLGVSPFGKTVSAIFQAVQGMTGWKWAFGVTNDDNSKICGIQYNIANNLKAWFLGGSSPAGNMSMNYNLDSADLNCSSGASNNLYCFNINTIHDGNDYRSKIKLFRISIGNDHFLPCRRKSDGVCGLLDCTSFQLLTDGAGGNAFVAGAVLLEL